MTPITKIISTHAQVFVDAVNKDIAEMFTGAASPKEPKASKVPKPAAKRGPKPGASRTQVDKDAVVGHAVKIVDYLSAQSEGASAATVRKALDLDKPAWSRAIAHAVKEKAVTTKGQKRATTYHAAA